MSETTGTGDRSNSSERGVGAYRNPWPNTTRGKVILGYFAGLSILYYVLLSIVGPVPARILGFPLLFWLTLSIYVLFAGGMYVLIYRPEVHDRQGARA